MHESNKHTLYISYFYDFLKKKSLHFFIYLCFYKNQNETSSGPFKKTSSGKNLNLKSGYETSTQICPTVNISCGIFTVYIGKMK